MAKIDDIKMAGNGCSISQSSASMMTEALKGKSLADSAGLADAFKKMMLENVPADQLPEDLEDLSSLEGVRKYPVRIKVRSLGVEHLLKEYEGLKELPKKRGPPMAVTVEQVRVVLKTIFDPRNSFKHFGPGAHLRCRGVARRKGKTKWLCA
jgi:hypothetical protein